MMMKEEEEGKRQSHREEDHEIGNEY